MARNGSGEYSLPANTAAVSGATISSTKFNSIMSDLESTLNTARPVVKGGTGATTASAARTNLGLAIGSDVQAYDAGLASIAGLTTAADKMIYTTALDTYAVADLSAFARTILDDADASAVRATIGAGTGSGDLLASNNLSDVASASTARSNLGLGALAVLGSVNNGNWSGTDLAVANGGTGASDASTARSNLGLGTMAVEASADYAALSGATFTGALAVSAASPLIKIVETDASADNGKWRLAGSAENLLLQTLNDAESAAANAIAVTRTGTTVDQIQIYGSSVYVPGNLGINTPSPGTTLEVNGTIKGKAEVNTSVSGTLVTTTHLRGAVNNINGNITMPAGEAGGHAVIVSNSSAPRTVSRDAGLSNMFVNGSNVSSATISGRGVVGVIYTASSICHLSGDVS
jgi:hypothetical protein